jgi:hypothetical protein
MCRVKTWVMPMPGAARAISDDPARREQGGCGVEIHTLGDEAGDIFVAKEMPVELAVELDTEVRPREGGERQTQSEPTGLNVPDRVVRHVRRGGKA